MRFRNPKDFIQERYDRQTKRWEKGLKGVERLLYQLPQLIQWIEKCRVDGIIPTIFLGEGEKDVDNLWRVKIPATTNAMGAGYWEPHYNETLRGVNVVIFPDNDAAGRIRINKVAGDLHGVANSVRIVELPGLPDHGDVTDWLEQNGITRESPIGDADITRIWGLLRPLIEAAPGVAAGSRRRCRRQREAGRGANQSRGCA